VSVEAVPQAADERRTRRARRRARQRAAGESQMRVSVCLNGTTHLDPSPQEITAALQQDVGVVWADVQGDPTGVMSRLAQTYNLSSAIQEALLDETARSRLLESRDIFSIVVNSIGFDEQAEDALVSKIDIVFGKGFVLTLHREAADWLDKLWSATHKVAGSENLMGRGVARLLHVIIDTLVDTYFPIIDRLDDLIDQLEDATVNDTSNTVQVRLFRMKRGRDAAAGHQPAGGVDQFAHHTHRRPDPARRGTLLRRCARPYAARL
jgi:Mg2+ and Co2+ transporter CorA